LHRIRTDPGQENLIAAVVLSPRPLNQPASGVVKENHSPSGDLSLLRKRL